MFIAAIPKAIPSSAEAAVSTNFWLMVEPVISREEFLLTRSNVQTVGRWSYKPDRLELINKAGQIDQR